MQTVAYLDRVGSKWYRAVVDYIYDDLSCILWLTDYGYATHAHRRSVKRLKTQFRVPESFGNIVKVGVSNVMPAKVNESCQKVVDYTWNEAEVAKIKRILEDASSIELKIKLSIKDHVFGKIKVETNDAIIIDLNNTLVKSPFGIKIEHYSEFGKTVNKMNIKRMKRYENIQGWKIENQKRTSNEANQAFLEPKHEAQPNRMEYHCQNIDKKFHRPGHRRVETAYAPLEAVSVTTAHVPKVEGKPKKRATETASHSTKKINPEMHKLAHVQRNDLNKLNFRSDDSAFVAPPVQIPHQKGQKRDEATHASRQEKVPVKTAHGEDSDFFVPPIQSPRRKGNKRDKHATQKKTPVKTAQVPEKTETEKPKKKAVPVTIQQSTSSDMPKLCPIVSNLNKSDIKCLGSNDSDLVAPVMQTPAQSVKPKPDLAQPRLPTKKTNDENVNSSALNFDPATPKPRLPKAVTGPPKQETKTTPNEIVVPQKQEPDDEIIPSVRKFLERFKRESHSRATNKKTETAPNTSRTLSLMPACFDQVIGQHQRKNNSIPKVPEIKISHALDFPKMPKKPFEYQERLPFAVKNTVMDRLDRALAEREIIIEDSTSDDGSVVRHNDANNVVLSSDVPIGPIDRFDET